MLGIGCDLADVKRIEKAIARKGFKERVFTPDEIAYCTGSHGDKAQSYAARFAAKEATQPLRHQAYMAGTEALRSNKVGNALFNLNNHLETANHFRKLAKENKEKAKAAKENEE